MLLKAPFGPYDTPFVFLTAPACRLDLNGLAVEFIKLGLVVEGVDVARPAIHKE